MPDSLLLPALLLGAVQGLTEFLPVSSTAHLAVLPPLLGWSHPLLNSQAFAVALHLGTLVALLRVFGGTWRRLAGAAFLRPRSRDGRLTWGLAIGTLPALAAGAWLEGPALDRLRSPGPVAGFLAAGAALLWLADAGRPGRRPAAGARIRDALVVGLAQACAVLPGLSRSGMTISAALFLGFRREEAARYSFLLSAPVIAAAVVYASRHLLRLGPGELLAVTAGIAAAGLTGAAAIRWLLALSARSGYFPFVLYRFALAGLLAAVSR